MCTNVLYEITLFQQKIKLWKVQFSVQFLRFSAVLHWILNIVQCGKLQITKHWCGAAKNSNGAVAWKSDVKTKECQGGREEGGITQLVVNLTSSNLRDGAMCASYEFLTFLFHTFHSSSLLYNFSLTPHYSQDHHHYKQHLNCQR